MTYLKLDDTLWQQPHMMVLSDPAWRLHLSGMSYASHNLTDGDIPEGIVRAMHPKAVKAAGELVDAGLWARTDAGWTIVGYLKGQRSKAQVEAIKEAKRKAGKKGGEAKAAAKQAASTVLSEQPAEDNYQLPDGCKSSDDDHPLAAPVLSSSKRHPAIALAGQIAARDKIPVPDNPDAFATKVAHYIAKEQSWAIPELEALRPDLSLEGLAYILATDGAPKAIEEAKRWRAADDALASLASDPDFTPADQIEVTP